MYDMLRHRIDKATLDDNTSMISSAGSHTYRVQWRVGSGTLYASAGVYSENFAAIEFKR